MQGKRKKELKQSLTAASFLAPSLLGLILFSAVPVVFSMFISLTDWNYVNGIGNWNFVWFENFKKLWSDEWFRASLCNTFVYTVVTVPIGLFLAVVIAVLIDQFCAKKLAGMLRVTMYMPKICNIVASAAVWTMLAAACLLLLMSAYGFYQMGRWQLSVGAMVKNALLLVFALGLRSFAVLLLWAGYLVLFALFPPYVLPVNLILGIPALLTVTAQAIYVPRIDKMMGMARDMEKKED